MHQRSGLTGPSMLSVAKLMLVAATKNPPTPQPFMPLIPKPAHGQYVRPCRRRVVQWRMMLSMAIYTLPVADHQEVMISPFMTRKLTNGQHFPTYQPLGTIWPQQELAVNFTSRADDLAAAFVVRSRRCWRYSIP